MKLLAGVFVLFTLGLSWAFADPGVLKQSDDLSFSGHNTQSFNLLESALPAASSDQERARIYWRLSRDTLNIADGEKAKGASSETLLALYKKGESYADQAMAADPANPKGYFWKAGNMGRWGQTRGIMASLSLADPIRKLVTEAAELNPSAGDPWFVLGQLYDQVPGFPISFGNIVWAVSLGRKAIDARKAEVAQGVERDVPYDYYVQLARHLMKRNWSAAQRASEQPGEAARYNSIENIVDKNDYYEGVVKIPSGSDRDEAREISRWVVSQLESRSDRTQKQDTDLKNARDNLSQVSFGR